MRGSGSAASSKRLGTLYGASARAQCARSSSTSTLSARARHDDRRDRLAPLRVRAAEHGRLEHLRMRLEHGLDLGGRDVLAAADDRVGLAPGHAQAPALVELAEIARVQPAVGCERRRRDASARRRRISPSGAIRTRVQNSGGPALAGASPIAATGVVVACEQLSVSP